MGTLWEPLPLTPHNFAHWLKHPWQKVCVPVWYIIFVHFISSIQQKLHLVAIDNDYLYHIYTCIYMHIHICISHMWYTYINKYIYTPTHTYIYTHTFINIFSPLCASAGLSSCADVWQFTGMGQLREMKSKNCWIVSHDQWSIGSF